VVDAAGLDVLLGAAVGDLEDVDRDQFGAAAVSAGPGGRRSQAE